MAPYNFVPLPEAVVPAEPAAPFDRQVAGRRSGVISCTITASSPLYIRSGLAAEELSAGREAKEQSAFFYLDPATREPVIPGSSLRGMLRALVEIAAYGKVDRVSRTPLVYRAVGDTTSLGMHYRGQMMASGSVRNSFTPKMQAGYLERTATGWQIRPAREIGGVSFGRIALAKLDPIFARLQRWPGGAANTRVIHVSPGPYVLHPVRGGFLQIRYSKIQAAAAEPGPEFERAALLKSGPMQSKRSEAVIFPRDPDAEPIPVEGWMLDAYRDQISDGQIELLDWPDERARPGYQPIGLLRNGQPVFYVMDGNTLVFFGHTMMFRIPYRRTPRDFVPAELRSDEVVDIAEAIFGFVRGDEDGGEPRNGAGPVARAGRIFVGDARAARKAQLDGGPVVPQILSGPKPTSFQHYLVQPEEEKDRLKHYASDPQRETTIRGHKLYWHKGAVGRAAFEDTSANPARLSTQHTLIEPVAPGSTFTADIHFDGLSDVELGALLWVLQLSAGDSPYRLKIGMGKPLGLGAVQLSAAVRVIDPQARYSALVADDGSAWATGESPALTPDEVARFVATFEAYVLGQLGAAGVLQRGARRLADLLRIRALLALLSWPGPQPAEHLTRYMEIDRRREPKIAIQRGNNEYKARPVLPTPLQVAGWPAAPSPGASQSQATGEIPGVGEVFTGKILELDDDGALVEVPEVDPKKAVAFLPTERMEGRRYRVGNGARVEVVAQRTLKSGRVVLEVKAAPRPASEPSTE